MRFATLIPFMAGAAAAAGGWRPGPDKDGKYHISAQGIELLFVPYGAGLSNLFVQDKHGQIRDVVMGFDNASYYSIDKSHPHLNGVPGRYANRIRNSTFELNGQKYHTTPNEGKNTLHGGPDGWDWRNWTVEAHTPSSITFNLTDPAGKEGFPGEVVSHVTYSVTPYEWHFKMTAVSLQERTPIMLTSHTYWNLDGFQNPQTPLILNHTLSLPYSGQRVETDGVLIPTGNILANKRNSVNDFWSKPKQIGQDFEDPAALGNCGTGCRGYDTCYIVNREQKGPYNWQTAPVATLSSAWSGIQVDVFTDQQAYQVYSCGGQNGTFALKNTQGFHNDPKRPRVVEQYGCIVMEVEDWIDAINQKEWQRDSLQVFGPNNDPYVTQATHRFSVNH